MALTGTTLAAACTANATTLSVTNTTTGFPTVGTVGANQPIQIDSEIMFVTGVPAVGTVTVRGRGSDGTVASAHDVLANVYTSSNPADFPLPAAATVTTIDPTQDLVISVGQDSTLSVPLQNTSYNLNKATAAAITLPAPSLALNRVLIYITSQTAAAHVVTATSLYMDGTSGAPKSTATFAAQKGATMTLSAENGFWNVIALQNVTLT
jgi:hypothetical protein